MAQAYELVLQNAQTNTGNGTVYKTAKKVDLSIFIDWSAGGSGGIISIEEAKTSDYAGTWSVIQTVAQAAASAQNVVHLSGVFKALRARISNAVTGGTVTITLEAHPSEGGR